jgi:hypothetical protein
MKRWIAGAAVAAALVGCSDGQNTSGGTGNDPIQAEINLHSDQPGMVKFLNVGRQKGVYKSPHDVDQIATFFSVGCTAWRMGVMQPARDTVGQLAAPE